MVFERLEHLLYYLPAYRTEINGFLSVLSADMKDGEYPIAGSDVFARVLSYFTKPERACIIEAHDAYIDIQSTLVGAEGIGIFSRDSLRQKSDIDKERDVIYFLDVEPLFTVKVNEGYFAMIFPHEAHRPETMVKQPEKIKKFVIKIKMNLFTLK